MIEVNTTIEVNEAEQESISINPSLLRKLYAMGDFHDTHQRSRLMDSIPLVANSTESAQKTCEILPSDLRLSNKLGEGQFGTVYKGCFQGQPCAVKVLKVGIDIKGTIQYEKLLLERSILAGVGRHPNIVQLLGACFQDDGSLMIVEEFVEGPDLEAYLSPKAFGFNIGKPMVRHHQSVAAIVSKYFVRSALLTCCVPYNSLTRLARAAGFPLVPRHPQRPRIPPQPRSRRHPPRPEACKYPPHRRPPPPPQTHRLRAC